MTKYRSYSPQLGSDMFACYTGMDADLLYNRGIDLPGFASYPLLSDPEHKSILREYYCNLVDLAREQNVGVILDSVTWVANRDRGAELGYTIDDLIQFNIDAIGLIADVRNEKGDLPTVLCGQVGPRGDGFLAEIGIVDAHGEVRRRSQASIRHQIQIRPGLRRTG